MFKGMVCDKINEYSYPKLYNESWNKKIITLWALAMVFSLILWKFPSPEYKINCNKEIQGLIERVDEFGMTNLHRAVLKGDVKIIKKLLKYNTDVNKTDLYGWSALHWARFIKKSNIEKILTDNGAKKGLPSTRDWFIYMKGTIPADINRDF